MTHTREPKNESHSAETEALYRTSRSLIAAESLPDLLQSIVDSVAEALPADRVTLITFDLESQGVAHFVKGGPGASRVVRVSFEELWSGLSGWVLRELTPTLSPKGRPDPRESPVVQRRRAETNCGAIIVVPLSYRSQVFGTMTAINRPDEPDFTPKDVDLMVAIANQAAVAIENARLYEEAQREIAERAQVEQALRESQERYRVVSELTSDFAYALRVEPDGRLVTEWVTEAFSHITGFSLQELRQRGGWQSFIHPDDLPIARQLVQTNLSGEPHTAQVRIITPSGQTRWLRNYGRPVWDPDEGRVVRIYGAAQDITEQKRLERYMLRTERLAAMGQIAAALAHEIKNPLQAVSSNLELALDFPLEPNEREEHLYICRREIERLAETTQQILNFARPSQAPPQQTPIQELVGQALTLIRQPLQEASVRMTTQIPPDLPPILVAPEQMVQVLLNLIINGIEAMPDGGHMHLSARQQKDQILLDLSNDGPPVPAEHLEQIFDPFFTTKPEGTGLGLPISHNIVQGYGGTIRAENLKDGQGVTFRITLPAVLSEREGEA